MQESTTATSLKVGDEKVCKNLLSLSIRPLHQTEREPLRGRFQLIVEKKEES